MNVWRVVVATCTSPASGVCQTSAARIDRGRRWKRRSGGRAPLARICALSKRVRLFVAGAVVVAALFVVALVNTSAGTNLPVAVFPSDGSEAASPATQISFRGAAKKDLTGISVTGSETGKHSGRLRSHSDAEGASFLPARPFKPGETVTVSADPDLVGAGGDGDVEFKIAETAPQGEAGLAPKINDKKVASQALTSFGNYNFQIAHREGSGEGEYHEKMADVLFVKSGEATLVDMLIVCVVPDIGGKHEHDQGSPRDFVSGGSKQVGALARPKHRVDEWPRDDS